jgi:hypothetical protein
MLAVPRLARLAAPVVLLAVALGACAPPASLAPARGPAGGPTGTLQVGSRPSGARIILDGTPTGFRTPTAMPGIAPGSHRLILSLAGHRNWEGSAEVRARAVVGVDAELEALAAGSLGVASVPTGAAIFVDGQSAALVTPAEVPRLPVGTHTVQLRRDGYEPWSQAVVILQDRSLAVQAVLTPARRNLGHVAVQSQPPRARILVDGFPTGKFTPDTVYALQPGSHRIELALEGSRPWVGSVTVREGQTENLLVRLQRQGSPETGSARIESDPPGAAIRLDGVALRQRTPAELDHLTARSLPLVLTRPGYHPWEGEVAVRPGERTTLAVRLVPEAAGTGSLRVESEPPGAAVMLDGAPTGAVTPALLADLAPAGHRVAVTLALHRPWVRVVQVQAGATEVVRARLAPRPWSMAARVVEAREDRVEIEVTATGADGAPAAGEVELTLPPAAGPAREVRIPLVAGAARQTLVLPADGGDLSFLAALGSQREEFVLRRTAAGWALSLAE